MSSQADALLAAATEEDSELGSAILGTMTLGTDAYNTDDPDDIYDGEEPHIVIGKDRFIIVPERLKRLAVQYDHNIETVTFDCPRYWDEHDMSKMKVYINYIRPDGVPGGYPVDSEITIDETDSEIMHFDWTISREVTDAKGNIVFLVCIKKVDDEGNEDNHWNSELCKDCYISEGLEVLDRVINEYPDLITHLLTRMDVVEEKTTLDSMLGYLDTYFTTDAEINEVLKNYVETYLSTDDEVTQTVTDTVNAYIKEHLSATDKTLTVDGGIADAKATGDKIKKIDGSQSLSTSILEKARTLDTGIYHYHLTGTSYNGGDLPSTQYCYSSATILVRGSYSITVVLYGNRGTNSVLPMVCNCYNNNGWSGWTTYATQDKVDTLTSQLNSIDTNLVNGQHWYGDFNTVTMTCRLSVGDPSSCSNMPSGASYGTLEVQKHSTYITQTYISVKDNDTPWFRTSVNSGSSWSGWVKVITANDFTLNGTTLTLNWL